MSRGFSFDDYFLGMSAFGPESDMALPVSLGSNAQTAQRAQVVGEYSFYAIMLAVKEAAKGQQKRAQIEGGLAAALRMHSSDALWFTHKTGNCPDRSHPMDAIESSEF